MDAVRTPEDFASVPFTWKGDLREAYPLGLQAVPDEQIVRIHSSSGTTGVPVIIPYTKRDVEDWALMFKRCYENGRRNAAGSDPYYSRLRTLDGGKSDFRRARSSLGAMAIPMGPGNTDKQLKMMMDLKSTVLCATSSYALLLAEEIARRGIGDKIYLRKALIGSERWGEKMRRPDLHASLA